MKLEKVIARLQEEASENRRREITEMIGSVASQMAEVRLGGVYAKWAAVASTAYSWGVAAMGTGDSVNIKAYRWMLDNGIVLGSMAINWFTEDEARALDNTHPPVLDSGRFRARALDDASGTLKTAVRERITIHDVHGIRLAVQREEKRSTQCTVFWEDGYDSSQVTAALLAARLQSASSSTGIKLERSAAKSLFSPMPPLRRVDLNEEEKGILHRIRRFQAHGYSRSILFYGPPGSGKTTRACALARHLNADGLILQIGSSAAEEELSIAVMAAQRGGFSAILVDDFDRRKNSYVFLEALQQLNGIPVFLTVNDIHVLDPASIRTERVDEHQFVGPPSPEEAFAHLLERTPPELHDCLRSYLEDWLVEAIVGWVYSDLNELAKRITVLGAEESELKMEVEALNRHRGLTSGKRTQAYLRRRSGFDDAAEDTMPSADPSLYEDLDDDDYSDDDDCDDDSDSGIDPLEGRLTGEGE